MALDANIKGNSSGNGVEVNALNHLKVTTETNIGTNPGNVGGIRTFSENDPGTYVGSAQLRSPEVSQDYRLRVGIDTVLFNDNFNASTQNTNNWAYTFATLTASQPGAGTLNFGTVQGTASTHGAFMRSYQYFPLISTAPLSVEIPFGQFTAALVTNEVWLCGLGLPSAAGTAPTDGVWVQLTSAGLIGVLAYNGSTVQTGTLLNLSALTVGSIYKTSIIIGEASVEFWFNDVLLGTIAIPVANGNPFLSVNLPIFMQKFCTGAVSNTNTMRVSGVTVSLLDIASNKPWQHQLATAGLSGQIGQNGHTQGKTTLWANNTAPTAVALTNTTAAFTGFGGIAAVLPTLTANNDGILFSYQNPVGTVNIPGRNLIITGAKVQGAVSVVLANTAPVIYAFAIAYGHTAVSLATTETGSFATATTHAPRIVPLGLETYGTNAAVGVLGSNGVSIQLITPIVVRPGEFVQIIARNIGTVTTTGAITFTANYDAYWE